MRKYINEDFKHFIHGADYNPEQWLHDKSVWDEDMRLMKLAGTNEMSVGIFSWAKIETEEGKYDFSWLDEILDKIYAAGGRVFLATPSGARPHWLSDKYPEVLRVAKNGVRDKFRARHNHCYTSPVYRKKVAEINERLSERYGKHPAVIGWHISNEYGGECYCPLCADAFRNWLRKKYDGDIEKLNFQWWTTFWSHNFSSFEQIEPPFNNSDAYASLVLDWRRFVSDMTADFIRCEVEAVRKHSGLPVTANFMHKYIELNYAVLEKEIDFISWDSYPKWHIEDGVTDNVKMAAEHALSHDAFRSLKNKPFALMECTPSHTNWQEIAKLKRPGMHKLSAMQAVAHGSDTVQYFQWRKSRGSNEKLHGAVVDHVGNENTRVFREVAEVGRTLKNIEEVLGSMPKVRVALLMDAENDWALELCQGFQKAGKKYYETCFDYYFDLWSRGIDIDVIHPGADFSRYELIIAPMLYMTSEELIGKIEAFVASGGRMLAGYPLGYANENDLCYLGGFPGGALKDVFGVWSEEIDTLYPSERNAIIVGDKEYPTKDYAEVLHTRGSAVTLGVYKNEFYRGTPALVKNTYGKGVAYYVGARDTGELTHDLLSEILAELNITPTVKDLPYGVTAHTREDDGVKYIFIENYNAEAASVTLPSKLTNLETKQAEEGKITLEPYGIRIYKQTI